MRTWLPIAALAFTSGCFYPPQQKPPAPNRTAITVEIPYDLALDAVQTVVNENTYRVITNNPNDGTIEAQQVGGFTLADADCGMVRGIGAKIQTEPDPDASAVYDFHVRPESEHASTIDVEATFTAPLHVPLHPISNVQCVSRGVQEAHLVDQIRRQALLEHRAVEHVDLRKSAE